MADHIYEEEQLQAIKDWWKENGKSILVAVVLGVSAVSGWNFWRANQLEVNQTASSYYEVLLASHSSGDSDAVKQQANNLIENYPSTAYASFAGLILAKTAVSESNLDDAVKHLLWVMDAADEDFITELARVRLARVYLAKNDGQAALDLLDASNRVFYGALVEEVTGDAYHQLGQIEQARAHYQLAQAKLGQNRQAHLLLQLKLDSLPAANASANATG